MKTKLPLQLELGDVIVLGEERLRVSAPPARSERRRILVVARSSEGPVVRRSYPAGYVLYVENTKEN